MTSIRALIFDLDDTLVSTAPAWREAEIALLEAIDGPELDEDLLASLNGRSARDVVSDLHAKFKPILPQDVCRSYFESALLHAMGNGLVVEKPGARMLVGQTRVSHRLAVASGSPIVVIHALLTRFGLDSSFECVVSSEEVDAGKPSPHVFLEAARRLSVLPSECLVLEDSLVGVQAARAAGMTCFAVPSRVKEKAQITTLAHRTFQTLADVAPAIRHATANRMEFEI